MYPVSCKEIYFEVGHYRDFVMNQIGLAKGIKDSDLIDNGTVQEPNGPSAKPIWVSRGG
jgi:hypothetical protein